MDRDDRHHAGPRRRTDRSERTGEKRLVRARRPDSTARAGRGQESSSSWIWVIVVLVVIALVVWLVFLR
jgi:hypothetical protein